MGSEEVGVVRSLGKKAVWILRRMAAGEGQWGEEEAEQEEHGDEEEADGQEGPLEEGEEGRGSGEEEEGPLEDAEEDGTADGGGSHASATEEEDSALAEARKRILASLDSAEPTKPPLGSKAVQDQPQEKIKALIEPQADAMANGPVKAEQNDLHSVHATLDMIVTIIGEYYGQRDLLDGRLLWEEIEWMNNYAKLT